MNEYKMKCELQRIHGFNNFNFNAKRKISQPLNLCVIVDQADFSKMLSDNAPECSFLQTFWKYVCSLKVHKNAIKLSC